jgi:hypothetical protein
MHVADQFALGIQSHQGLAGQGAGPRPPQGLEPMLGALQMMTIENGDFCLSRQNGTFQDQGLEIIEFLGL